MNAADDPGTWRRFADMDLEAARVLVRDERLEALAAVICFHAHQSAEKYLKGLLVASDQEPPRIHALPDLLRRTITCVSDLDSSELRDAANNLNVYYIPSRYPAEVGGPAGPITAEEVAEALTWAEEIAAAVRPLLGR
ncbi:MAG TPA: HEPN domain-containing protein [Rubrobacteraceae bacterium]|nr:HEPN domain-containing protein [Rubrobacteraceae bacterium]